MKIPQDHFDNISEFFPREDEIQVVGAEPVHELIFADDEGGFHSVPQPEYNQSIGTSFRVKKIVTKKEENEQILAYFYAKSQKKSVSA